MTFVTNTQKYMPDLGTKILTNSWYADDILPKTTNFISYLHKNYNKNLVSLAGKSNLIKNVLFYHASTKFDLVIAPISERGVYYYLLLEALFSEKNNRVIMLEFIRANPHNKLLNLFYPLWVRYFFGPVLRKTLLSAQVLTTSEINSYATQFKIPESKLRFIPWPLHFNKSRNPNHVDDTNFRSIIDKNVPYVMVSGLGNVDWETIFEVAERSEWQLLAVCSKKHLQRVNALNVNKRAKILNDISQYDHAHYVQHATVYALCLEEFNVSVGQIRLMNTIEHGIPVVATDVIGLRGYAVDGVNALMVPPKNPSAFKIAIDKLMNNAGLRDQLTTTAKTYQTARTFKKYIDDISQLVHEAKLDFLKES